MHLPLDISDWIDVAAVIVSLLIGVISIIIAVLTLRQSNKMIEESTRPYITVYSGTTCFQTAKLYVILKNFGSTGATITKFQTSYDLKKLVNSPISKPFEHIVGTFLAPGQSMQHRLDIEEARIVPGQIEFEIEYTTAHRTYSENVVLNIEAVQDIALARAKTQNHDLKIISNTLQDFVEKQL